MILLGGPFDQQTANLRREPERIEVAGVVYERINDPDTGEGHGAYVVAAYEAPAEVGSVELWKAHPGLVAAARQRAVGVIACRRLRFVFVESWAVPTVRFISKALEQMFRT